MTGGSVATEILKRRDRSSEGGPRVAGSTTIRGHVRNLLLVETSNDRSSNLDFELTQRGFVVTTCVDGAEALLEVGARCPDVILIAREVPLVSGATFVQVLRRWHQIPVIIGVDSASPQEAMAALAAGATACVSWPFRPDELMPILAASADSNEGVHEHEPNRLTVGDVVLDLDGYQVWVGGREVHVPLRELRLLIFLMRNAGHVLSREAILQEVWGTDYASDTNTVSVHVLRLRRRLEPDPKRPKFIQGIRGLGYRLNVPQAQRP